jgi:hypothetical protein
MNCQKIRHKAVGFRLVMDDARKTNCAKPIARQWCSWLALTHTIEKRKSVGRMAKQKRSPTGHAETRSPPAVASACSSSAQLTNALLQVAEHVVGLRFDCLGKGSVHTLGLGVELSLAGLILCGIHLCYLFFRLVAMPCGRGRPAALHAGQTVEIPTVQRLRVVWPCVAGCRDTVSGSRWTKMPHLKRPVVSRQAARIAGWADLISGRPGL